MGIPFTPAAWELLTTSRNPGVLFTFVFRSLFRSCRPFLQESLRRKVLDPRRQKRDHPRVWARKLVKGASAMNDTPAPAVRFRVLVVVVAVLAASALLAPAASPSLADQEPNTWVKRSPLPDAPTSPGMGYETSLGYDPVAKRVLRWGGHNQGGGGAQNAEMWVLDPAKMEWTLQEPTRAPPGVCCAQQNVFDPIGGRFLRFPAFSGSHGWHWYRENYHTNTPVWSYDLPSNTWRELRPAPAPRLAPLRCASWDSTHQVAVVFGGEGSSEGTIVYDPHTNNWTRMNPKTQPSGRSGGTMAYDSAHRLHILFGSQFTDDPHTWAYDLAKNEWRDLKPETQPPGNCNDAVLAYDDANEVVVAVVRVADKLEKNDVQQ